MQNPNIELKFVTAKKKKKKTKIADFIHGIYFIYCLFIVIPPFPNVYTDYPDTSNDWF